MMNILYIPEYISFLKTKQNKQEDKNGYLENACHLKGAFMGCQVVCLLKNNVKQPCSGGIILVLIWVLWLDAVWHSRALHCRFSFKHDSVYR